MDDLLGEFLTETAESLDVVDVELVKFEKDPNNSQILDNIFRLVHTIKGTCGFLGLPRLEALAHAGETLMGKFRDGASVTGDAVSLILISIDRIKEILNDLESQGSEPEGSDEDLIAQLDAMSALCEAEMKGEAPAAEVAAPAEVEDAPIDVPDLGRELKPGEVSLDDLERAFMEAEGPELELPPMATPAVAEEEPTAEDVPEVAESAAAPVAEAPKTEVAKTEAAAKPAAKAGDRKEGGAVKTQSIRVNVDTLEHLMTMVSELVLTRNQLLEMVRRLDDSEFKVPLQRLSNVTAELQEGVMKTRMQPIGNAWQKLPRIVRDLSNELGKKIDLQMFGAETELDRQVLELIKDPLTHMVRNSADHGIEATAEDRLARGKAETGVVRLSAYHEGGHIIIEIADDGRGLNVERIREKAIENGVATEAEMDGMTTAQINKFIFAAGFSTATNVTSVSGRGVGMDVVRTNIELIGGSVDVKSTEGQGSTFTIKIPLTLAIVSALIVKASEHRFAMPQLNVVELVRANNDSEHRIEQINQTPVLRLRNRLLPLIRLTKILGIESESGEDASDEMDMAEEGFIIVTQVGAQNFGIVVDGVFDTEEIVVKPMSSMLRDVEVFSGNTILGDGSVILIIDPNGVAQRVTSEVGSQADSESQSAVSDHGESSDRMSMLLFRAGSPEPKAVPLSLVTRLEQLDVDTIETVDGRELVQYRGQLMPLLRMPGVTEVKEEGRQPILVFSNGSQSMGLAVDEIVDIVAERLDIEVANDVPGKVGSAVIREHATEVIDVGHYIGMAFDDWEDDRGENVSSKPRLLLVDDSAFFRDMLAPVLIAAGYAVTSVDSVKRALALKDDGARFDVIVSDIEMPEIDGYRFAASLKDDANWGNVPIVALSCQGNSAEIKQGRNAGFFDLVGKFDREGLVRTLGDSLANLEEAA